MNSRYPKARSVGFSLLLFLSLTLAGCSCQERYAPYLKQVEENMADAAPKYREALEAQGLPEDVIDNRVGLLDDTAAGAVRVRTHGPDAWKKAPSE